MGKLSAFKKNKGANLKKLQDKLESQNNFGPRDERIWKPKFNKDKGKGSCVVRFLTPKEGDPFVHVMNYQFGGPGGNFWDLALQTIGEKDPVQLAAINAFRKAKAEGDEKLKTYAKKFLPKNTYYANVMVLKDEENPDNEGKVMIYQFGRQIFQFIENAINPEFDDVDPMDPFDYWGGADFTIRMIGREIPDSRTGQKVLVPNYEKSSFDQPSEFMDGDEEKIEPIYDQTYDLSEFLDPEKFKTFDEVAERFRKVTGKPYNWLSAKGVEDHVEQTEQQSKMESEVTEPAQMKEEPAKDTSSETETDNEPSEESPLEKFRRLSGKK